MAYGFSVFSALASLFSSAALVAGPFASQSGGRGLTMTAGRVLQQVYNLQRAAVRLPRNLSVTEDLTCYRDGGASNERSTCIGNASSSRALAEMLDADLGAGYGAKPVLTSDTRVSCKGPLVPSFYKSAPPDVNASNAAYGASAEAEVLLINNLLLFLLVLSIVVVLHLAYIAWMRCAHSEPARKRPTVALSSSRIRPTLEPLSSEDKPQVAPKPPVQRAADALSGSEHMMRRSAADEELPVEPSSFSYSEASLNPWRLDRTIGDRVGNMEPGDWLAIDGSHRAEAQQALTEVEPQPQEPAPLVPHRLSLDPWRLDRTVMEIVPRDPSASLVPSPPSSPPPPPRQTSTRVEDVRMRPIDSAANLFFVREEPAVTTATAPRASNPFRHNRTVYGGDPMLKRESAPTDDPEEQGPWRHNRTVWDGDPLKLFPMEGEPTLTRAKKANAERGRSVGEAPREGSVAVGGKAGPSQAGREESSTPEASESTPLDDSEEAPLVLTPRRLSAASFSGISRRLISAGASDSTRPRRFISYPTLLIWPNLEVLVLMLFAPLLAGQSASALAIAHVSGYCTFASCSLPLIVLGVIAFWLLRTARVLWRFSGSVAAMQGYHDAHAVTSAAETSDPIFWLINEVRARMRLPLIDRFTGGVDVGDWPEPSTTQRILKRPFSFWGHHFTYEPLDGERALHTLWVGDSNGERPWYVLSTVTFNVSMQITHSVSALQAGHASGMHAWFLQGVASALLPLLAACWMLVLQPTRDRLLGAHDVLVYLLNALSAFFAFAAYHLESVDALSALSVSDALMECSIWLLTVFVVYDAFAVTAINIIRRDGGSCRSVSIAIASIPLGLLRLVNLALRSAFGVQLPCLPQAAPPAMSHGKASSSKQRNEADDLWAPHTPPKGGSLKKATSEGKKPTPKSPGGLPVGSKGRITMRPAKPLNVERADSHHWKPGRPSRRSSHDIYSASTLSRSEV